MYKLYQFLLATFLAQGVNSQNVGIGTTSPSFPLEVAGSIKGTNLLSTNYVGIGTNNPIYKLHIHDGSVAITNTTDAVTWTINYSSGSNALAFGSSGNTRMVIQNAGNVGIGTTAPLYKLDVAGSIHTSSNVIVDGNLTVDDGKGILRNGHGSTQLKYYTFTESNFVFTNFQPNSVIGPVNVAFPAGAGFTSAPRVMIANYTYISGSAGKLFSIIPAIYSVSTTGFEVYFFNSSASAATMTFTMSFVCIGSGT